MAEKEIVEEMKKKVFFSRFSNAEVVFVDSIEELTEEQLSDKTKAFFDGLSLLDNVADVQDDFSNVVSITNRGRYVNLQDYYERYGAFDQNPNKFLEAIKKLKDKESITSVSNYIDDIQNEEVIKLLNDSVDVLNLPVRASNTLKNLNIRTILELIQKTEDEICKTRNFGKISLSAMKDKLNELGLSLGMKYRNDNLAEPVQKDESEKI